MSQDSGSQESVGLDIIKYVEPNSGREHFQPGQAQSVKDCSKCIHFDTDLASDYPCGLCYESEDKYEYTETGDVRCGEMELPSERVCETPTEQSFG